MRSITKINKNKIIIYIYGMRFKSKIPNNSITSNKFIIEIEEENDVPNNKFYDSNNVVEEVGDNVVEDVADDVVSGSTPAST